MSEKIPEGWKRVKLGEVAELSTNIWKVGDEKLPYIGLEHIDENKLRLNSIGNSDDINSIKYIFTEKEFLFGKLRPYFRKLYNPKFKGICSTDIWVVKPKNNIDKNFLFYLFATQEFVDLTYKGASGTRMPRADWKFVKNLEWIIPEDINEQKAIASVLSALDDKIDLLHRQNQTLEKMAETLFRKWFIKDAKEDWEEVKLGDFFPIITGKKNANFATDNGKYPFFTCSQKFLKASSYSFEGHAILLAGNGDFNVKRYNGKFEAYQRTYVLIPYNEEYVGLLYTLIKYFLLDITGSHKGSVINFITKEMIENFSFKLPKNREEDENFKEKLANLNLIYKKVDFNLNQIQTLENLRDTLLPKLMSGEVRVKGEV